MKSGPEVAGVMGVGGEGGDENVRVVVRVRPMNDTEKNQDYRNIVQVDNINGSIQVKAGSNNKIVKVILC